MSPLTSRFGECLLWGFASTRSKLVQGEWFRRGLREVVVSESLSRRFQNMRLGDTLHMSRSNWKVVGIFNAGGTAYDSEVWTDAEDVAQDWDRPVYSSLLVEAVDAIRPRKSRAGLRMTGVSISRQSHKRNTFAVKQSARSASRRWVCLLPSSWESDPVLPR